MVTHDPNAAEAADRVVYLADGRVEDRMTRVGLRGITTRRLRTVLTALAIVLGVAMASGSYTLTDTMRGAADSLSSSAYDGTAAVVFAKTAFKADGDFQVRPPISEGTLDQVRAAPGSRRPSAASRTRHGSSARTATSSAPARTSVSGSTCRPASSPLQAERRAVRHRPGSGRDRRRTADREGYSVGDTISVQARPERKLESAASPRSATSTRSARRRSLFDLHAAQSLFDKQGRYTEILVGGPDSVRALSLRVRCPARCRSRPRRRTTASPRRAEVVREVPEDPAARVRRRCRRRGRVLDLQHALDHGRARSRELALLRALGATWRQVLRSVVVEALAIGTVASAIGVAAGLGLAKLLNSVFASAGVDLPSTSTVFGARTIIVSLAVGIVVTVVGSARRSVPPASRP